MTRRSGLTRIDILVGFLIAVLVVGLYVTTAARIRETADSVKCQNNLKQFGLAVHNYASANETLPPLVDMGAKAPTGRGLFSLFAELVPYLEATPYYRQARLAPNTYHAHSTVALTYANKGEDGTSTVNGGLANWAWAIFADPADGTARELRDVPMTLPDGTTGYYATSSYAANGLLPWATGKFSEAFPRGPATTILFGERPQVCRTAAGEKIYNLWGLGCYSPHMPAFAALTPDEPPGLASTGQAAPALPLPAEAAADRDALIRWRVGRHGAAPTPPDRATVVQVVRSGRPCDPRLPGTPHRGGMQVAMADGSVRVFAPDTSPWVFWRACVPGDTDIDR